MSNKKEEIYEKICKLLTEYENNKEKDKPTDLDFYDLLIEVQNNWNEIKVKNQD